MLGTATSLKAEVPTAAEAWVLDYRWENDGIVGTDNYYTNGWQINYITEDLRPAHQREALPEGVAGWLVRNGPFAQDADALYRWGLHLAQDTYTPRNFETPVLNLNDRPYAGWMRLAGSLRAVTPKRMDVVEVSLGLTGPWSGAEAIQKNVHKWIGNNEPKGWDNQIPTEPTLQASWNRYWHLREDFGNDVAFDMTPRIGMTLGNARTHASAGVEFRGGWYLPYDYGVNGMTGAGTHGVPYSDLDRRLADTADFSIYGFLGGEVRAVARDMFLDGSLLRDSHSVDKEHFVGEFRTGGAVGIERFTLSFATNYRSPEFEKQPTWHLYATFSLAYVF